MGMAVFRDGSDLPSEEVTDGGGPRGKPGVQRGAPLPPYPSLMRFSVLHLCGPHVVTPTQTHYISEWFKVCGGYSETFLYWTPIFDWYVVQRGSKNKHRKQNMFLKDWTVSSSFGNYSTMNMIGRSYIHVLLKHQQTCTSNDHN